MGDFFGLLAGVLAGVAATGATAISVDMVIGVDEGG